MLEKQSGSIFKKGSHFIIHNHENVSAANQVKNIILLTKTVPSLVKLVSFGKTSTVQ